MKKIAFIIFTLIMVLCNISLAQESCYDVKGTKFEKSVKYLMEKGIVNGFPDNTFKPDQPVTRAQLAKMLVEALNLKEIKRNYVSFKDIDENHWAFKWVKICSENKIVVGYEDDTFRPEQNVSFNEAITMVIRAMDKEKEILKIVWPDSYIEKAEELGLLENVTYQNGRDACNRGYTANLIVSMMISLEDSEEEQEIILIEEEQIEEEKKVEEEQETITEEEQEEIIDKNTPIREDGLINNDYFGIKKNGSKDDALDTRNAINQAIEFASEQNISYIKLEKGTYILDIPYVPSEKAKGTEHVDVIIMKSNIEFDLNDSTFQLVPNSLRGYSIIACRNIENAVVKNGTLKGERFEHTYNENEGTHEYGACIRIKNSQNIIVKDMELCNGTGDGIGISGTSTKDIQILNNDIHDARRNGMSIICADGLLVKGNEIYNIYGTNPQKGMDFERNNNKEFYKNVTITENKIFNTKSAPITFFDVAENIQIFNNSFTKSVTASRLREPWFNATSIEDVMKTCNIKIFDNKILKDSRIDEETYGQTQENVNTFKLAMPLEKIELSTSEIVLKVGDPSQKLKVIYTPELFISIRQEGQSYTTNFTSSDTKIAKVNKNTGAVTAVSPGEAIITATTVDGKLSATCKVIVPEVRVEGISLSETKLELVEQQLSTLNPTLKVIFSPSNATNQKVEWTSSDSNIATVGSTGKIAPKKAGTCIITAKSEDGGYEAQCEVEVKYVAIKSMTLNQEVLNINVGDDPVTLNPVTIPEVATKATRSWMKWTSSDENVATVSKGIVTPVAKGTCIITAATSSGKISASCEVTVN